jgi:hypothetical protein
MFHGEAFERGPMGVRSFTAGRNVETFRPTRPEKRVLSGP